MDDHSQSVGLDRMCRNNLYVTCDILQVAATVQSSDMVVGGLFLSHLTKLVHQGVLYYLCSETKRLIEL